MTALPSPEFTTPVQEIHKPKQRRSQAPKPKSLKRQTNDSDTVRQHKLFAASGKLAIYSLLSVLSIASLVNLLHYSWTQQSKLHQLRSEVKDAKQRVAAQNAEFQHSFDPRSGKAMMQENSYRIAADKQPVIIYNQPKSH
jgi:hypothetical protein